MSPDPESAGEGNPLTSPVIHRAYDKNQNLLSEEDAPGNFTYYTVDARDRLIGKTLPDPDGSGEGHPLTAPEYHWTYDAASQLLTEEDPLGNITEYIWDNLGNKIQTILPDPDGTGELNPLESPVWQYAFDAGRRLITTTDPRGNVTTNEYDLLDNLITQTLPDPDGTGEGNPLTSPVYQWVYDAAAQLRNHREITSLFHPT